MKLLISCLLVLCSGLCYGQHKIYISSYRYTSGDTAKMVYDSCYTINDFPSITHGDTLVIRYGYGHHYYFKEYKFVTRFLRGYEDISHIHRVWVYRGFATCGGNLYRILSIDKPNTSTVWLTPTTFNSRYVMINARGFCISNDYNLVRTTFPKCLK